MSRKRWLALIAAAMLFVISISINLKTESAFGNANALLDGKDWTEAVVDPGDDIGGTIALLELNGVIEEGGSGFLASGYQHETFLAQLDHAAEDANVEGIIIKVNTPGGGVVESAQIYDKIVAAQEEYGKPVFISMGNMAASGGYYISAPADLIVASPQTITGSIGVIMESVNVAELAEKYGIKFNTIKSGPHKDILSPTREMTEEERDILQALIDESFDEFVNIIATGRDMSENEVRKIADGRIYSGKQALELNLVDELGTVEDTIKHMRKYVGSDYPVVKYESAGGLGSLFALTMETVFTKDNELATLERMLSYERSPMLKYLYTE